MKTLTALIVIALAASVAPAWAIEDGIPLQNIKLKTPMYTAEQLDRAMFEGMNIVFGTNAYGGEVTLYAKDPDNIGIKQLGNVSIGSNSTNLNICSVVIGADSFSKYFGNVVVGLKAKANSHHGSALGPYSFIGDDSFSSVAIGGATINSNSWGNVAIDGRGVAISYWNVDTNTECSVAIGNRAQVGPSSSYSTALGFGAVVNAQNAVQIGRGTNSREGTVQIQNINLTDLLARIEALETEVARLNTMSAPRNVDSEKTVGEALSKK